MTPGSTVKATFDLGALAKLEKGIPDYVFLEAGKYMAAAIGRRIKYDGQNAKGEELDPNSPGYADFKQENYGLTDPLVATGEMTDHDAWDVVREGNSLVLILNSSHQEKWDNIIEIARKTGRNWEFAFDLSENELAIFQATIIRWLQKECGVEPFQPGPKLNLAEFL